jgi:ABC-type amino acid transport system permease subunit
MEPIKVVIVFILLAIVASLGSALFHLSRGNRTDEDSRKMARALTVRVGLSLVLFLLLMAAGYFGLLKPLGVH